MELDAYKIKKFLREQDINYLYHANTVTTASTFIKHGGLLSRGEVESRGLNQTPQSSDPVDKEFNIWFDIFLDSVDLHKRFNRQNYYGPILFKFNIDILDYIDLPPLWITKDNPIRWEENQTNEDRYFQSFDELVESYEYGSYREMITLRFTKEVLPFDPYLEEIIIDNPRVLIRGVSLKEKAIESIQQAIDESNYSFDNVEITLRECKNCFCHENYLRQVTVPNLEKAFYNIL